MRETTPTELLGIVELSMTSSIPRVSIGLLRSVFALPSASVHLI
jgi:hypothetical protein